jgi:hypothetical protein
MKVIYESLSEKVDSYNIDYGSDILSEQESFLIWIKYLCKQIVSFSEQYGMV